MRRALPVGRAVLAGTALLGAPAGPGHAQTSPGTRLTVPTGFVGGLRVEACGSSSGISPGGG